MDNLAAMEAFVRVVEAGGLSAAGRVLGRAPSSISRRISELEDSLGVTLLHRTTRKLSLTEAGENYYERTREIVRAVEEANLAVTERRGDPSGTLRVTVPASVAHRHIAPAVAAFQNQYPTVSVVMRVTDRLADIVEDGLDVALRIGRLEDSTLVARRVGVARRVICASPAYLKRAGRLEVPAHLSHHACLTFRTNPGANIWRFRNGKELSEVRATGSFYADDGETLTAAACTGLGLIVLPEWLVGREISQGALVEVLAGFTPEPAQSPLYAVYASSAYTPPKVRAFVDFLAGRFSKDYAWSKGN